MNKIYATIGAVAMSLASALYQGNVKNIEPKYTRPAIESQLEQTVTKPYVSNMGYELLAGSGIHNGGAGNCHGKCRNYIGPDTEEKSGSYLIARPIGRCPPRCRPKATSYDTQEIV